MAITEVEKTVEMPLAANNPFGLNMLPKPWSVKATEYIVIKGMGMSRKTKRGVRCSGGVQVRINTTEYFINLDGSRHTGILNTMYDTDNMFRPRPCIYLLPGQYWSLIVNMTDILTEEDSIDIGLEYIVVDGSDAVFISYESLLGLLDVI